MRGRWAGETVCIAACGPSLTADDVSYAYAYACRFVAVNESWRLTPAADVLYAADVAWWKKRAPTAAAFAGERWTASAVWTDRDKSEFPEMNFAATKGGCDLTDDFPICTGNNSSFQAMSLAILWGARRIVFIGLDMKLGPKGQEHWFGSYHDLTTPRNALGAFIKAFNHVAPQCVARGVEVINASRDTALECFPRMRLEDALS